MASMAFSLIGTMIGGPIGGAIFGILGGLVQNMISGGNSTKYSHTEGPKLTDKSTPLSTLGAVIPRVYGTGRVGTNMIWFGSYVEKSTVTTTKTGGGSKGSMMGGGSSGGKTQNTTTTYYYYGSWASLIGKGPISGIKRIWMNGQLVYNADRFISDNTQEISFDFSQHFTLYPGVENQPPDPTIQGKEGTNAPAYRGYAYIVFTDVLLERFGNRVPQVDVEVVSEGTGQLPIYEVPVPLSYVVATMLRDVGMDDTMFDVSQLSDMVSGYSDQDTGPLAQKIQTLASIYLFDVVESDGKLKFVKQPAPTYRREYQLPCMINELGLIVNSFQDAAGRQGYFDAASGTSEGQLLLIRACCAAYEFETDPAQKQAWYDRALFMAAALEPNLYRAPVPGNDQQLWVPHWLFAVKRPIQMQSWMRRRHFFSADGASPGTLRCIIENIGGEWGGNYGPDDPRTQLVKVYQVYADRDSYLLWDNPYSGVVGNQETLTGYGATDDGKTWVEIADPAPFTEQVFGNGTYKDAAGDTHYTYNETTVTPSGPRAAMVVYGANSGPVIETGESYEAWPHWRTLAKGEVCCATDTLYWGADAYDALYTMTKDPKWFRAASTTRNSILQTHAVQDGRDYLKPQFTDSAFSMSGSFDASSRANMGPANWMRDPTIGDIVGNIPANASITNGVSDKPSNQTGETYDSQAEADAADTPNTTGATYQEAQFGRGIADSWREQDQYLQVEFTCATPTTQLWIYLDTAIKYNANERYYAALPVTQDQCGIPQVRQLKITDFTAKDSGAAATGSSTGDPVLDQVIDGSTSSGVSSAAGAPYGNVSVSDGVSCTLLAGVQDGSYYFSGGQVYFNGAVVGKLDGDGSSSYSYSDSMVSFTSSASSGSINITGSGIGPSGNGGTLPVGSKLYAVGFSYTDSGAQILTIHRVRPYPIIQLKYAPYATPFTCNILNNVLVEWRGSPGTGYTFPHGWARMAAVADQQGADDTQGNAGMQMQVQFLKDSQDAWQAVKGHRGPFAPCYVWDRADNMQLPLDPNGQQPQPDTWTWSWYDPNTEWGGYKYRPLESVCRAFFITNDAGAQSVAMDFLGWLDANWQGGGTAPFTNYPLNGDPYSGYGEPHFASLVMRASMWVWLQAYQNGNGEPPHVRNLIHKCYLHMQVQYIDQPGKQMDGSFANGHDSDPKTGAYTSDPDDYTQWDWYGFWHGEIIDTLSKMMNPQVGAYILTQMPTLDQPTMLKWLRGSNGFLDRWTRNIGDFNLDDLGVKGERDDEGQRPYTSTRMQELELPQEVQIKFANADLAYAQDVRYARRQGVVTKQKISYDLPVAISTSDADLLVSRMLYISWTRRTSWQFTLPQKYFMLDAGDVIAPVISGQKKPIFITKAVFADGMMQVSGVSHDPEVYRDTAPTGGPTVPTIPTISGPVDTTLRVMNLPLLSSDQDGPVYYVAATGPSPWSSGYAMRSQDKSNFEVGALFNTYVPMGIVSGVPGDGPSAYIDRRSSLNVIMVRGELGSVDESELSAGKNACIVGDEVLQFANAVKQPDGSYLLYTLLRGRLGTEWAMTGHVKNERFVMIDPAMVCYTDDVGNINRRLWWKGISSGQSEDAGIVQPFTFEGRSLKPYSPVHIGGSRTDAGDCQLTWVRRSRIPSNWSDGAIEPPLGEAQELYEIDFCDADGNVVDTVGGITSPAYIYPAARQVQKFGAVQYWIRPRIYQISATVGRGYAGTPADGGV